jgi:hypothetical protein
MRTDVRYRPSEPARLTVPGATARTGVPTAAVIPMPWRGMRVLFGPMVVPNG